MEDEYIIYSDESDRKGLYYSYFLGAFLIKKRDQQYIISILTNSKNQQTNNVGELKWNKITKYKQDLSIYSQFVADTFLLIQSGYIKCRISFVPNSYITNVPKDELSFLNLYDAFLCKNFGYCASNIAHIHLDRLPYNNKVLIKGFKNEISTQLNIKNAEISEIDSSKHIILQALDVILGGICAKLNQKLNDKGLQSTVKSKIYKLIHNSIISLTPQEHYEKFNVSLTSHGRDERDRFEGDKYRHYQYQKIATPAVLDSRKTFAGKTKDNHPTKG